MKIKIIVLLFLHSISNSAKAQIEKCFSLKGLKYEVTIKIRSQIPDSIHISGEVASKEYASPSERKVSFVGTSIKNFYKITFKGKPPIVGDNSEWTTRAWELKKNGDSEKLVIVFNAKDYDSHIWQKTNYEFLPCTL